MKRVNITVTGQAQSGKSTVATTIARLLQSFGANVEHSPGPDGPLLGSIGSRMLGLVDNGLLITIREEQEPRKEGQEWKSET